MQIVHIKSKKMGTALESSQVFHPGRAAVFRRLWKREVVDKVERKPTP